MPEFLLVFWFKSLIDYQMTVSLLEEEIVHLLLFIKYFRTNLGQEQATNFNNNMQTNKKK